MNGIEEHLAYILKRGWWSFLLRGVAAIVFGVLTLAQPGIALISLVLAFGAYAVADGALGIYTAIEGRAESQYWWLLLLSGLVGVGIGVLTFMAPGITALMLLFYIATWAIARGMLEIAAAIRLRKEIHGEWVFILAGLASIAFGVIVMARPGAGALTVLGLIAGYAIVYGVLLLILAFKARSFAKHVLHAA